MKCILITCTFTVALLSLPGCASIVSGRHAEVAIDSYPSNAHVVIHDDRGRAVTSLDTPGVASLKRNRRFFLPARYTATLEAPGYEPAHVPIRSTVNPWILGNIVFGGIPGLIVDNATGAAWMPRHSEIHRQLAPLYDPQHDQEYWGQQSALEPDESATNSTSELKGAVASRSPVTVPR